MTDEIAKYGLFYDDLYSLRVLEPEVATETQDLVEECSGYAESMCLFLTILHSLSKYRISNI